MKRIIGLLAVLGLLAGPALAQVAANEVRVFKEFDFVGASASFKLEADMRHKLVPYLGSLNQDVSSILIGADVAVLCFSKQNFFDPLRPAQGWGTSLPRLRVEWNDEISSLIVYRKKDAWGSNNNLNPFGIYLVYGQGAAFRERFIALPEKLNAIETRVPSLESDWDNKAQFAGVDKVVEARLFDLPQFKGSSISLPGAAPDKINLRYYTLNYYGFNEKLSSLIVRLKGAAPPVPERGGPGGTPHRAPPAGTAPTPMTLGTINANIAGTWKSNTGLTYEITQENDRISWLILGSDQKGMGTVAGNTVNARWYDSQGSGAAKGNISLNAQGKAIRIDWSNGVIFTR
jgi:hypothetical protein